MRLNVMLENRRVGQLLSGRGRHFFEYDVEFIRNPLPLSPFRLPVERGVTEHRNGAFHTLPGLIADSLPDKFGIAVLREQFARQGIAAPSPLQMLAFLGRRTMGALTYEPPEGDTDQQAAIDLVAAARSAKRVLERDHGSELDLALISAGGTAGGMMPKVLAALSPDHTRILTGADRIPEGMEAWLIKFNQSGSNASTWCHLERAYFAMAEAAGVRVPETRLLPDRSGIEHFAIRRFDRAQDAPNQRQHMHSYSGLMELDMTDAQHDYDTLLRVTNRLTANRQEVEAQFRRMLFNLLGCNGDDHAKNFSFSMDARGEWSLTPAYDLTYSENSLGGNWMLIGGKRSGLRYDDLLQLAETHAISKRSLDAMLAQLREALAQWPDQAERFGIGQGWRDTIARSMRNVAATL